MGPVQKHKKPEARSAAPETLEPEQRTEAGETLFVSMGPEARLEAHREAALEGLVAPRGKILGYLA